MPEIELKPCPFCGSTDLKSYVEDFIRTYVECKSCGVKVQGVYNKKGAKEAKELWNRRAPNDPKGT